MGFTFETLLDIAQTLSQTKEECEKKCDYFEDVILKSQFHAILQNIF